MPAHTVTPSASIDLDASTVPLGARTEVAFVLDNVADWRALAAGLPPGVEVVVLDCQGDGLAQMAQYLAGKAPGSVEAIHVLGHGSSGALNLGALSLSSANLAEHAATLAQIGQALTPEGDWLLYGCDVAAGGTGIEFVSRLAQATGADVAASANTTGATALGGDWVLEATSGTVQTSPLQALGFEGVLATNLTYTKDPDGTGVDFSLGTNVPSRARLQDINGDGKLDLLVAGDNGASVSLGNGDGTFAPRAVYVPLATNVAKDVQAADIDGDGKQDLLVFDNTGTNTFTLIKGDGSGAFASAQAITWVSGGSSPFFSNNYTLADVTGDGKVDVVVADGNNNYVTLLTNTSTSGNFSFSAGTSIGFSQTLRGGLYVTDVDGDNDQDVIAVKAGVDIAVLTNTNGVLSLGTPLVSVTPLIPSGLGAAGDLNGDGKPELAFNVGLNLYLVVSSTNGYTLSAAQSLGSVPKALAIADVNADGKQDVVVTYGNTSAGTSPNFNNKVTVLTGNGDGTIAASNAAVALVSQGINLSQTATAIGDLNGDSHPDLVVVNGSGSVSNASVYLNSSPPPAPTVTGVTASTANGNYKAGDTVSIQVTFSESVTVTGTPQLTLETGATDRVVNYASGSPGTTLTFTYTVQAGDTSADLDYTATTALALNAGTIVATMGGATAVLTLPAPGSAGSLGLKAIVIDTTPPGAPSTPDLEMASDLGPSSTDNLTSRTTPTFSGTAEAGATVTLYDTDGTTALGSALATGGQWSITTSTLSAGAHIIQAKATDAAGNVSAASGGLSITIDTAAPTDVAVSATTTAIAAHTTVGSLSTTDATAGDAFTYSLVAHTDSALSAGNGSFAISNGSLAVGGAALTDGSTYNITVRATDAAGNTFDKALTINAVDAPVASAIMRAASAAQAANGANGLDFAVTFSRGVNGVTADDFTVVKGPNVTGSPVVMVSAGTDGASSYTLHVAGLSGAGDVQLQLNSTGTGIVASMGNAAAIAGGYTSGQAYTLDTTPPAAPTFAGTGATSNATPALSGTAEAGATVSVVMGGATYTTRASGQGVWSVNTASDTPASGTYTPISGAINAVAVTVTDAAGNASNGSFNLALDTVAPSFNPANSTPADNATNAGVGSPIVVRLSERLHSSSDLTKVYLKHGTTHALIPATVTLNADGQVVITPTAALAYSTGYYVNWDANALKDAAGNALAAVSDATTFNFGTEAVPEPEPLPPPVTTTTVDGTTVQSQTTAGANGSTVTTQTVAPVTAGRTDADAATPLADIPLGSDSTGAPSVLVSLPVGVGLSAEAIQGGGLTLRDKLIQASQPRISVLGDFQAVLQSGIDQYVPSVGDASQVTVRTVTLTVPVGSTTVPGVPIVIQGASGAGEGDAAHPQRAEALVIDARNLPVGTALDLNQVEFAIIIGPATVTGGAGRNQVIGDGSSQRIVLGPQDDVIRGGAGNDTVGSKGGNDQLFGDEGNDTVVGGVGDDVLEGGAGNDVLQGGASDAGAWVFTLDAQGQLSARFAAGSADLAGSVGFSTTGAWRTASGVGPLSDDRFAWVYDDPAVARDAALLVQALAARLPSLAEMGSLAHGGFTSLQLGQMAHDYFMRTVGSQELLATQSLQAQVAAVVSHVWGRGSATPDVVALGVSHLEQGGAWSQVWLALARSAVQAGKITDAQGRVSLASQTLGETGWSAQSGNDILRGGEGSDVLVGGDGSDTLDGGAGTDLAVYLGAISDYQLSTQQNAATGVRELLVRHKLTGDTDTVIQVEFFRFGSALYQLPAARDQATYGEASAYLEPASENLVLVGIAASALA